MAAHVERLTRGKRPASNPVTERLPVDEFENQVSMALDLLEPVDRGNVGKAVLEVDRLESPNLTPEDCCIAVAQ